MVAVIASEASQTGIPNCGHQEIAMAAALTSGLFGLRWKWQRDGNSWLEAIRF